MLLPLLLLLLLLLILLLTTATTNILQPTIIINCYHTLTLDYVKRVMDMCDFSGVPVVMVNPQLINMDQGYGVRKAILT